MTCPKDECPNNPKAGDIVHVRMRVVGSVFDHSKFRVRPLGYGEGMNFVEASLGDLVKIEKQPLKVGDVVRGIEWVTVGAKATIVAIDGEKAWLKFPDESHGTYKLKVLERVK